MRDRHVDGNVYEATQCEFTHDSNEIEGSRLSPEETAMVTFFRMVPEDDMVEMANHLRTFNCILDDVEASDGAAIVIPRGRAPRPVWIRIGCHEPVNQKQGRILRVTDHTVPTNHGRSGATLGR